MPPQQRAGRAVREPDALVAVEGEHRDVDLREHLVSSAEASSASNRCERSVAPRRFASSTMSPSASPLRPCRPRIA